MAADFISRRALAPVLDGIQKSAARLTLRVVREHLGSRTHFVGPEQTF